MKSYLKTGLRLGENLSIFIKVSCLILLKTLSYRCVSQTSSRHPNKDTEELLITLGQKFQFIMKKLFLLIIMSMFQFGQPQLSLLFTLLLEMLSRMHRSRLFVLLTIQRLSFLWTSNMSLFPNMVLVSSWIFQPSFLQRYVKEYYYIK